MGYHDAILSDMAKRPLDKDELRELLVVLFGKKVMLSAPDIHTQWDEFYEFLTKLNKTEGKHWKAQTRRVERWIDVRKINKMYGDGSHRRFFGTMFSWRSWRKSSPKSPKPVKQQAYKMVDI